MHYVYILRLRDERFYIGYSSDLKLRIKDRNRGAVKATKNLRPVELIYYSTFSSKRKAISFENYLKSSSGFAFRNKRLI